MSRAVVSFFIISRLKEVKGQILSVCFIVQVRGRLAEPQEEQTAPHCRTQVSERNTLST